MADISEYVAAAIATHIKNNGNSPFLEQVDYDGVREVIEEIYGVKVPVTVIKPALNYLEACGVCQVISDPYARDHFLIDEGANDAYVRDYHDTTTPFGKACRLGASWVSEALSNIAAREFPHEQEFRDFEQQAAVIAPASDRLVRLDDNQPAAIEIIEGLRRLSSSVRETNDEDGKVEDRDRLIAELEAGAHLLSTRSFRVKALWAVLAPSLLYLAATFSESVIGALASDLYNAVKIIIGL